MNSRPRIRLQYVAWTAVLAIATGFPSKAADSGGEDIGSSLKLFTKVLDLVESNFAEKVNPQKALYEGAIPGMLRTLDPHSSFFDPKELQRFRENQRGQYFGVGMLVGFRNGHVTVQHPFENSPAKKAGLRPGDQIFRVNGKNTEKSTVEEVVQLLKGPRGTPVQVSVKREGRFDLVTFDLYRDQVERPSVPTYLWLKPGVGYVRIETFNQNTSREFENALKTLGEDKMEGLIIDLRDNGGGILQEAVAVVERFLERGQAIVSQRGRISTEHSYTARRGNAGRKYPLVVMVDRGSASASEILSGALQDHDRAWIFGDNTFGKGLVQAPYELSGDCSLLLTVARFYTPSGRLIQRDYSKGSFFEYYYKQNTATRNPRDQKATDSGRIVYGGGGIAPDEKYEPPPLNRLQMTLLGRGAFFYFTAAYFGPKEEARLPRNWEVDEITLMEFKKFLGDRNIPYLESEFQQNLDWIKRQLRIEMLTTGVGKEYADEVAMATDPEVLKAAESLPKARALLEKSRRMVAERKESSPENGKISNGRF
ncbi:MAG: S41 family peptidase [Bryobacteraceae bacterium]|nr:S41 family peptidase [Bryobacteraceae bacterium]MDW8379921.1 S41 family peptidase [Bryobacterales bacterium]